MKALVHTRLTHPALPFSCFPVTQESSRHIVDKLRSHLDFDSVGASDMGDEAVTLEEIKSGLRFQTW